MECVRNIGDIYDDPLIQLVYVKFYKAITTKDRHECAENLAMIQQLIGMAMYEHGIRYDESGLPIRVPIKGKEDEESGGVENGSPPKPGGQVLAANCGVLLCPTQKKAPLCLCHMKFGAGNKRFRLATQTRQINLLCREALTHLEFCL